jgi:hypothetical protein
MPLAVIVLGDTERVQQEYSSKRLMAMIPRSYEPGGHTEIVSIKDTGYP